MTFQGRGVIIDRYVRRTRSRYRVLFRLYNVIFRFLILKSFFFLPFGLFSDRFYCMPLFLVRMNFTGANKQVAEKDLVYGSLLFFDEYGLFTCRVKGVPRSRVEVYLGTIIFGIEQAFSSEWWEDGFPRVSKIIKIPTNQGFATDRNWAIYDHLVCTFFLKLPILCVGPVRIDGVRWIWGWEQCGIVLVFSHHWFILGFGYNISWMPRHWYKHGIPCFGSLV